MTSEQELAFAILCSPLGWPNHKWREARQQIADLINSQAKECSDKDAHVECLKSLIEQLYMDIVEIKEARERESERLDWLFARISDDERNRLIGQMTDRNSVSEWREKIDAAIT